MALIKWEPFNELDRFFEDLPMRMPRFGGDLAVDVYEKDNNIIAEMNVPSIDPERVNVSIEDNYLRISGSREEEHEEKNKKYYSKEIRRGSFERMVRLPGLVQQDKVVAEYDNGTLRITMPRSQGTEKSPIKIQVKKKM